MLLNEHNSKMLFAEAGISIPPGITFTQKEIGSTQPPFPLPWFLKAQVLTGGRGKAGGIIRVDTEADFKDKAQNICRLSINGHSVPLIRIEPAMNIQKEFYLSLTVSRERQCLLLTAGREGGMEIESLDKENLLIQEVRLPEGLQSNQIRAVFFHLDLPKTLFQRFSLLVTTLFKTFLDGGLLLAEINPLILTNEDDFMALDGKVEIDDNVVTLNPDLERFYQPAHASIEENRARVAGLSFIKLPGWVGLMVNGAGLAMATMDLLNFSSLPASNFLDLGGAADKSRMATALDLLFKDTSVEAIFINLFGGILSCKDVARALEAALEGQSPEKPIVARMSGKDAEEAIQVLQSISVDNLHIAKDMAEAMKTLRSLKPSQKTIINSPQPVGGEGRKTPPAIVYQSTEHFDIQASTPILVQGITGREGQMHTRLMQEYGANIVAGVTPFKGGRDILGVPVYNSVAQAMADHEIGASIIFVPPAMAADAILEAAQNNIPWTICITEGIPQHAMMQVLQQTRNSPTRIVGPNTPGILIPEKTKIGILPTQPFTPGPVAILSRSGTLTYEAAQRLSAFGIGQSLSVGIGGDPFIGTSFVDMFEMIRNHDETKAVVVLGEIGGKAEEDLARYVVETGFNKPVVSFIAGQTAPPGKRLGHAGAILDTGVGGIRNKISTMLDAGFSVCRSLREIPDMTIKVL